jgi:arylsulfatase A-like enzyme
MKTHLLNKGALLVILPAALSGCRGKNEQTVTALKPNILIVMGDDISWPHMGAYGTKWVKTPGFDRVASQGLLFGNAYTPNAKSSPSRACFLTGRNSWQLEEAGNHVPFFPSKFTTFIEALGNNGYVTGFTAKGWAPGIALDSAGNPRKLTGTPFNDKKLVPPATGISRIDYAGNFEDFLARRNNDQPFCFWYGSTEPHRSYEYGSGRRKGGKELSDIPELFAFWPDNEIVRNDILDYAYEIEYFDSHLVKMLEILEKKGELDNTIVIVTADNGMPFPRVKGQPYEYSNHMPLAIMWGKGIKNPGRKVSDFISFIDFAPTLLEISGIDTAQSGMQAMQGKSFTYLFSTTKKGYVDGSRDHVIIGQERHDVGRPDDAGYPVRGIVKEGFLYLRNFKPGRWPSGNPETGYLNCDGSPTKSIILSLNRTGIAKEYWNLSFGLRGAEELYELGQDPACMNNLANNAGYSGQLQKMSSLLFDKLREQNDPRVVGDADVFDRYIYADNSTRDFYNRYMKGLVHRKAAGWVDSTDFEGDPRFR